MVLAKTIVRAFCVLLALATVANAKVVQETIELPVEVVDIRGTPVRQSIKVTVLRDDSRALSPFLILNHGRSGKQEQRQAIRIGPYLANAQYFVAKGFAVFLPIRVGYGDSGGPDVENSGSCDAKNYGPGYEAAAVQSLKVIDYAKTLPYIDKTDGLVVGQSFGGTTAIALAAKNIPGVKAAVNFAAGGGGRPDTHPGQPCSAARMTELFASYGQRAQIPTLWLYSENDKFWGPALPRAWHKAFVGSGGSGKFEQLPPYKDDGHPAFTGAPKTWQPAFEAFLASCCLTRQPDSKVPPAVAAPQRSDTPEAFTQALVAWAGRNRVDRATILVRREGRIVHQAGLPGTDPAAPVLLASLSKAITGACVATLVRDGVVTLDQPLSKSLAKFFKAHGRPKDARLERVTVAQLLTHRAGFAGASDGEDPATRNVLAAYLTTHSTRSAPSSEYISGLLNTPLVRDPGFKFTYSNAGYFILGAVIEEATGQSYETFCRDNVLKPAGALGMLDPTWAVLWSAGGWRMTGTDYLAFLEQFDPKRAAFGKVLSDWMLDPADKAFGTSNPQSWYGPGIRLRDQGRGIEVWHTGSWRRILTPDKIGSRSIDTRTFAMRVSDGTSWFVHHSAPRNLQVARLELDRDLRDAYKLVKTWK